MYISPRQTLGEELLSAKNWRALKFLLPPSKFAERTYTAKHTTRRRNGTERIFPSRPPNLPRRDLVAKGHPAKKWRGTKFCFPPFLRRVPATDTLGEWLRKRRQNIKSFARTFYRVQMSAKKRHPIFAGCGTRRNSCIAAEMWVPMAGATWSSVSPRSQYCRVFSVMFAEKMFVAECFIHAVPANVLFAECSPVRRVSSARCRLRSSSPSAPDILHSAKPRPLDREGFSRSGYHNLTLVWSSNEDIFTYRSILTRHI